MKKQILLLAMMLLVMAASAEVVEINGIYFSLSANAKQAEVTRNFYEYTGSIDIPASVSYKGTAYSVTSIGRNAFRSCSDLTSVTIPSSVTSIGESTFRNCSGLTSVTIPSSVTSIGDYAFDSCWGLTSVHISDIAAWCMLTFRSFHSNPLYYANHLYIGEEEITNLIIPNGVASIGDYAFSGCSGLTSVTIPSSVLNIGAYAFEACEELTDVYCLAEEVPTTHFNAFEYSHIESVTLHVPTTAINGYKTEEPWKYFKEIVALTDQELSIDGITKEQEPEVARYTIGGQRIGQATKGLNIVRMSDGTTKKVIVK